MHPQCEAIVGGFVYHGTLLPMLQGCTSTVTSSRGASSSSTPTRCRPSRCRSTRRRSISPRSDKGATRDLWRVYDGAAAIQQIVPLP